MQETNVEDLDFEIKYDHAYWVLVDTLTQEEAECLSKWKNSKQDQHNSGSGASLTRTVKLAYTAMLKTTTHPKVAKIIQAVEMTSIDKVKPNTIGGACNV